MAANKLPDDALLDDLCTRFILNVPAEELAYAHARFGNLYIALLPALRINYRTPAETLATRSS